MSLKQEEAWLDGWNELYEKLKQEPDLILITLDWLEMSQDETLGYIQNEAYAGYRAVYQQVWYKGRKALQYYRGKEIE